MYCMFGWDKAQHVFLFMSYVISSCSNLAVIHYCQALQGQIQPLSLLFWPHLTDQLSDQVLSLYFSKIVLCLIMSAFW